MSVQTPEQKARDQIDAMLTASGWGIQNYAAADFSEGRGVALREVPLSRDSCDYFLLVDRKVFGEQLPPLFDGLNEVLAA